MHASRRNTVVSFAAVATAIGASLLATACGGGGKGDFSNASLVTLNTATVPAGATGREYATQVTADFPHQPGQFILTAGRLPPGLELNNVTGEITGFPRQLGRFNFDISARDGLDPTLPLGRDMTFSEAVKSFAIDVALGTPNILPQVLPAAQYRKSYLYPIDVAGGTPPYTFTLEGGTLPAGIALSPDGKLGNFPTQANVAVGVPFGIDVKVTDANNLTDTAHFDLNVVVLPLIILTSNIQEAAQNFPYNVELVLASTGGGQPITWSQVPPIAGETLLDSIGMEITTDGHLRNAVGFPGPTSLGTKLFTIQVTDEAAQVTTRQFALKVNPGPVLNSITPGRSALPGPYIVTGLNFQPGAVLVFKPGLTEVTVTPAFISPTELRMNTAPFSPGGGGVAVKVINPDTGSFTKANAYIFAATNISFTGKGFVSSNVSSTGLDCADVNGDGSADVIHSGAAGIVTYPGSSSSASSGLIFHRNLGTATPTFASQTMDSAAFYGCKFADVNSDGKLDIVGLGLSQVKVWLNGISPNPLGTFSATPILSNLPSAGTYGADMIMGMFNTGSVIDLAYSVAYYPSNSLSGRVYTMTGNGAGVFTTAGSAATTITSNYGVPSLCSADSDGDGREEICAGVGFVSGTNGAMFKYGALNADATFTSWVARGSIGGTYYASTLGLASGDFEGTGTPTVLGVQSGLYSTYYPVPQLRLFSGTGFSTVKVLVGPSTLGKRIGVIDADFDTKMDWAISAKPSTVEVYRGATQVSTVTLDAAVGTPSVSSPVTGWIASGDLNGDGRPELLVSTSSWICEGMASAYSYSGYANGISGDGGSKGFVFYLNTSN